MIMYRILTDISIVLNILGFGQGVFLCVSLWRTKKKRPENVYLIYLLIGISVIILNAVFRFSYYINDLGFFEPISNSFLLIIGPSAYVFIQFKTGRAHQHLRQWLHYVPFFIYFGFNVFNISFFSVEDPVKDLADTVAYLIFNIQFVVYFGLSLYKTSTIKPLPDTIKWLRVAIWLIIIPWIIQLFFLIVEKGFGMIIPDLFTLNLALLFGVCAFFLSYVHTSGAIGFAKGEKYEASGMDAKDIQRNLELLKKVIIEEELYLDKELSLAKVSKLTQLTPRNISQSVNLGMQESFVDLINSYRIEVFKRLIKKGASDNYTMVAIAEHCGFKSSSAFYAAFKKHTGKTPKQYKNELN